MGGGPGCGTEEYVMIKGKTTRISDRPGESDTVEITYEEDVKGAEERFGIPADVIMSILRQIPAEDLPTSKVEILSYVRSKRNGNVRRIRITTRA